MLLYVGIPYSRHIHVRYTLTTETQWLIKYLSREHSACIIMSRYKSSVTVEYTYMVNILHMHAAASWDCSTYNRELKESVNRKFAELQLVVLVYNIIHTHTIDNDDANLKLKLLHDRYLWTWGLFGIVIVFKVQCFVGTVWRCVCIHHKNVMQ